VSDNPPRILIAKPGLDGHDRGARVLVRALQDAGLTVDYTGIRRTPEQIVEQARDFGAEIIGVSIHSGAHMNLLPRILDELQKNGLENIRVFAGGIIPQRDRVALLETGVSAIFGPGSRSNEIIAAMRNTVHTQRQTQRKGKITH
jgi:methylmalonyl-CoA mutase C-terminal domain/subunit